MAALSGLAALLLPASPAFAQCAPAAPAPLSLTSPADSCEETGGTRINPTGPPSSPAVDVSGGATYIGRNMRFETQIYDPAENMGYGGRVSGVGSRFFFYDGTVALNVAEGTPFGFTAEYGGYLYVSGSTITTMGELADGIRAIWDGSHAEIANLTISVSGLYAWGISASAGGLVTGQGARITVTGDNGSGLGVDGAASVMNLTDVSVVTSGLDGVAAYVDAGAMTLTNFTAVTSGAGAGGATVFNGGRFTLTNGNISFSGDDSTGVLVSGSGQAILANTVIAGTGARNFGLVASGQDTRIEATGGSVSLSGTEGGGLNAASGTIIGSNLQVTTTGAASFGAQASTATGRIELTGGSVTTSGVQAHGLMAIDGAFLSASGTAVATTGAGAAAILAQGGSTATPNRITLQGGSLSSSQGPLILAEGAVATISISGPSAISAGLLAGRATLASIGLGTDGLTPSRVTLALSDVAAVAGEIAVAGSGSQLDASLTRTSWTGDLRAEAGSTANLALAASQWRGLASNGGNIGLDGGSSWFVTGTSTVAGTLTNAGLIDFVPQGGSFSTLTTGSLVGQGGRMNFNTVLGADASPTNLLILKGGTASGATALSFRNAGGDGALTTGDGIRVVQAIEGATTGAAAFSMAGRTAAGAYEYLLFRGGSASAEDWYLRSSLIEPAPGPSAPGASPQGPSIPLYRPEVPLYTPIPAMARQMGLAMLGTLHERVGEQMNVLGRGDGQEWAKGGWARLIGERSNSRWSGTAEARIGDANLVGFQAGFDIFRRQSASGHRDHVGVYVGFVDFRSSQVSGFALGQRNLGVGRLALNGPSVGAYWTHYGPSGWYLDAVIQGHWFDAKANSAYGTSLSTSGSGVTASLEAGYPLRLADRWQIEPQGQIIFQRVSVDRGRDAFSRVDWKDENAVTGRLGARLQYTARDGDTLWQPYAKANLWHAFSGTDWTSFGSSTALPSRFGQTSVELGLGVTARITRSASLYGHVDHRWSVDGRERHAATQGTVGLRVNW